MVRGHHLTANHATMQPVNKATNAFTSTIFDVDDEDLYDDVEARRVERERKQRELEEVYRAANESNLKAWADHMERRNTPMYEIIRPDVPPKTTATDENSRDNGLASWDSEGDLKQEAEEKSQDDDEEEDMEQNVAGEDCHTATSSSTRTDEGENGSASESSPASNISHHVSVPSLLVALGQRLSASSQGISTASSSTSSFASSSTSVPLGFNSVLNVSQIRRQAFDRLLNHDSKYSLDEQPEDNRALTDRLQTYAFLLRKFRLFDEATILDNLVESAESSCSHFLLMPQTYEASARFRMNEDRCNHTYGISHLNSVLALLLELAESSPHPDKQRIGHLGNRTLGKISSSIHTNEGLVTSDGASTVLHGDSVLAASSHGDLRMTVYPSTVFENPITYMGQSYPISDRRLFSKPQEERPFSVMDALHSKGKYTHIPSVSPSGETNSAPSKASISLSDGLPLNSGSAHIGSETSQDLTRLLFGYGKTEEKDRTWLSSSSSVSGQLNDTLQIEGGDGGFQNTIQSSQLGLDPMGVFFNLPRLGSSAPSPFNPDDMNVADNTILKRRTKGLSSLVPSSLNGVDDIPMHTGAKVCRLDEFSYAWKQV